MADPTGPDKNRSDVTVTIEGYDLPGRTFAPANTDQRYENVHVGVQRLREVVEPVPGDAPSAQWSFPITATVQGDETDLTGPYVHGRRGDRFLYLSWGGFDGEIRRFRRAKLLFGDCPAEVLAAAIGHGQLRCRVSLTDAYGYPRCARVRPPDLLWFAPENGA